ncbi:class I SAM-dependent methyltransferase [Mycobacterium hubeiense]|uniref:class I SAM-dependent methyltransferase n=1 Tax=Mycobacterium hubeiense TaxID=1867256 RepID=UPI000C7ED95B|nr:class I SAM-dependent methyltransferase [Mycobacterium sp. QGD 101]
MRTERGRAFNTAVTRFWSVAAPLYDTGFVQRWAYRPPQDEIIGALRKHGSRRVADIGCGTGILADRIQRELHLDEVYGVDMSDGMLAQARARSSTVQWLKAPAEQLPFEDGALDAVVTTSAFHFFDQPAALREFHRVLVPGGFAAVAAISPSLPYPLERLSASLRNPAHNPSPAEVRALFEEAGLAVDDQHPVRRPIWTRWASDVITVGVKV